MDAGLERGCKDTSEANEDWLRIACSCQAIECQVLRSINPTSYATITA